MCMCVCVCVCECLNNMQAYLAVMFTHCCNCIGKVCFKLHVFGYTWCMISKGHWVQMNAIEDTISLFCVTLPQPIIHKRRTYIYNSQVFLSNKPLSPSGSRSCETLCGKYSRACKGEHLQHPRNTDMRKYISVAR